MKDETKKMLVQEFPWDEMEPAGPSSDIDLDEDVYPAECTLQNPWEAPLSMNEVSRLLDRMIMDIQHLEVEVVRARYKLSFFLTPPYDEYLRDEIFSSLGSRYDGDPVYDQYLSYCGLAEDEDAIDTPFHVKRMIRLASGHDDHPYMYP